MVRLTIWDKETAYFRELQCISNRKNQVVIITSISPRLYEGNILNIRIMSNLLLRNISLLQRNYYSPQHQEHASASILTTTLTSYIASKRRINFYPPHECMTTHRLEK